jgi:hypothetical protein
MLDTLRCSQDEDDLGRLEVLVILTLIRKQAVRMCIGRRVQWLSLIHNWNVLQSTESDDVCMWLRHLGFTIAGHGNYRRRFLWHQIACMLPVQIVWIRTNELKSCAVKVGVNTLVYGCNLITTTYNKLRNNNVKLSLYKWLIIAQCRRICVGDELLFTGIKSGLYIINAAMFLHRCSENEFGENQQYTN